MGNQPSPRYDALRAARIANYEQAEKAEKAEKALSKKKPAPKKKEKPDGSAPL